MIGASSERGRAAADGTAAPDGSLPVTDLESMIAALMSLPRVGDAHRQVELLTHVQRRGAELGLEQETSWAIAACGVPDVVRQAADAAPAQVGAVVASGRVSGFDLTGRIRVAERGQLRWVTLG